MRPLTAPTYRSFSPALEALAATWRQEVVTQLPWRIVEPERVMPGEARTFFVTAGEVDGFAKPGRNQPPVSEHPRAAHEKVAADLAFELGLPVPPAVLWDRRGATSEQERYVAISALPFAPAVPWRSVLRAPELLARLLPRLGRAASAMAVFDSWLGNADRVNAGNVVLRETSADRESTLQVAYIDFANALSRAWLPYQTWSTVLPLRCYPEGGAVDLSAMSDLLERIERLDRNVIADIVARIPEGFLSDACRAVIVKGLLHRQTRLRMATKKAFPDLP
jgi:hypothetical protein